MGRAEKRCEAWDPVPQHFNVGEEPAEEPVTGRGMRMRRPLEEAAGVERGLVYQELLTNQVGPRGPLLLKGRPHRPAGRSVTP